MPLLPIHKALAHAIAEEMQEVYRNELGHESVPFTVPWETVDEVEVSIFCSFMYYSPGISGASSLRLYVDVIIKLIMYTLSTSNWLR